MDTTRNVLSRRDQALLYGDYSSYRAQLSRRLLTVRKRLGRTTKKGAKYINNVPITALDIGNNNEFIQLLLLTSERAWAHAMYMKSAHSADAKGITGATRSHIISRLHKAAKTAEYLLKALEDQPASKAANTDILEMRAYSASLIGAEEFEKRNWEACVNNYAISWVIYTALGAFQRSDTFKDLLSGTVEPSIRYSAYQIHIPRTVSILTIARKYFPRTNFQLVSEIDDLDSGILGESATVKPESTESETAPRTIKWRSRAVEVEDASISVTLSAVAAAARSLEETLSLVDGGSLKEKAAAYDEILIASQDAVDSTKHAMDELLAEGISQSDKRMQSLQIIRTAVSYDMISWRIGRNRALTGEQDGALQDNAHIAKYRRLNRASLKTAEKEEGRGRKLARLRENVVLYDSTLQSLESIKGLPGVAADPAFLHEIEAKYHYFRALKCLAIARSHSIFSEHRNALALLARATDFLSAVLPTLISSPSIFTSTSSPITLSVSSRAAHSLSSIITAELHRHRALTELSNRTSIKKSTDSEGARPGTQNRPFQSGRTPLVENLNMYHVNGVELSNLVKYPPRLEPIPVKPLFLDVAWNHIRYPSEKAVAEVSKVEGEKPDVKEQTAQAQRQGPRKGWFGFGR